MRMLEETAADLLFTFVTNCYHTYQWSKLHLYELLFNLMNIYFKQVVLLLYADDIVKFS